MGHQWDWLVGVPEGLRHCRMETGPKLFMGNGVDSDNDNDDDDVDVDASAGETQNQETFYIGMGEEERQAPCQS